MSKKSKESKDKDRQQGVHACFQLSVDGCFQPPPLENHSHVVYNNSVYTIGGVPDNPEDFLKKDHSTQVCFRFDLNNKKWAPVLQFPQYNLQSHTSVIYNDTIYVVSSNRFFYYNLKTKKSNLLKLPHDYSVYSHGAVINKDAMYLFGGMKKELTLSNNMWKYDLKKREWSEVQLKGKIVPARSNFAHALYEEYSQWFVFSGKSNDKYSSLLSFSFKTKKWNELLTCPYISNKHEFLNATAQIYKDKLFIYGGCNTYDDHKNNSMFCYSILEPSWKQIYFSGVPQQISCATSIIHENLFITIGGKFHCKQPYTALIYYYEMKGHTTKEFAWKAIFKRENSFNIHFLFI